MFSSLPGMALAGLASLSILGAGCTSAVGGLANRGGAPPQKVPVPGEELEYLRTFSKQQRDFLNEIRENGADFGVHKAMCEYAGLLREQAPRILLIVDRHLPAKKRHQFRAAMAQLDQSIVSAERENEREAAEGEGGTIGRLLRDQGRLTAMRMRFTALRDWIPFLPQPLDDEIRTISKWAEKDQGREVELG